MKEFLTSGQVGNIELNEQRRIRKQIVERWEGLQLLNGLSGILKENIATIYENEAKALLSEATDASNSGSFETVVFPLVRRIFSKLLANDIVSVQAMNLPIGKLFYVRPVTSEREWSSEELTDGVTGEHVGTMGYKRTNMRTGAKENRFYLPDDAMNSGASVTSFSEKSLYDLFYNDFLYDNSKGKITIKVGEVAPVVLGADGKFTAASGSLATHTDGTIRNVIVKVSGFSNVNAGRLTGPDGNEMDTEAFLASLKVYVKDGQAIDASATETSSFAEGESIPFRVVTQKYGKGIVDYGSICDATGAIYIELDLAKPTPFKVNSFDGFVGVAASALTAENVATKLGVAWAQYDSLELETEIGEVSFNIDAVVVSVTERKLRATWSPEMASDVNAFHSIDAEAELTSLLSEQVAAEIDREILRDLRKLGPWTAQWDANGWRRISGFSTNYTQKDWNQELMTVINQISAQIHKSTLRGGANYVVVSAEISALLNNLEYFHVSDASAESDQYNMGIERVGSLEGRYQVYMDPYAPAQSLILGHKGKSLLDTGYIYAPYIPMQLTPVMYNPFNASPVRYILTRYAKKSVNNRYFGSVIVRGLRTFDINELR